MTRNQARLRGRQLRTQPIDLEGLAMTSLAWLAAAGFLGWAILWAIRPPY
ncbi:MAG: hypothetical protein HY331_17535 [Chloroflexi bacterium]|nr:hypothetical protein [Chloroflexota bacterium]